MSERDWKRKNIVERVERREVGVADGASALGLTPRWLLELRKAYREGGAAALAHGNKGRRPANQTADEVRAKIVMLARTTYLGFNDQHFTEKLVEVEALEVSRSTVRRVLREAGIGMNRRRRGSQHRKRRDRRPQAGLMVLWDGSRHDWLEGRGPYLCLMGAIDDATGEVMPGAHFVDQECSAGYLRTLRDLVLGKGIPHSVYMDRHGSLQRNDDHWTLDEQLRGEQDLTHVGQALRALEITAIAALSPQAKGRVERLWKTLQDRLVSELRLANACTMAEANEVLRLHIPDHNSRFAVEPKNATAAWRPVRSGLDVERACSFRYEASVGNDNAVRLAGKIIDIPPGRSGRSYAKARSEVRQLLDGTWRVYVKDALVATSPATSTEELRPLKRKKRSSSEKAFRRELRTFEVPPKPASKEGQRHAAKRSPRPAFNDFGQLRRKRSS